MKEISQSHLYCFMVHIPSLLIFLNAKSVCFSDLSEFNIFFNNILIFIAYVLKLITNFMDTYTCSYV